MEKVVENRGLSFHGEIAIIKVDRVDDEFITEKAKEVSPDENGMLLIAHSESGHHHYIEAAEARFYEGDDPNVCYLKVADEAFLKHLKPDNAPDKHGTQRLSAGDYIIKRQREETPEGWRQVQD